VSHGERGGCTLKTVFADKYWHESFSLFCCGKLIPELCPSILDKPCTTDHKRELFPLREWWYNIKK